MLIRNNIAITEDEYIDFIKHMIDFLEYHKRKIVVFTNGAIDDYEFACFALRSIGKEKLLEKGRQDQLNSLMLLQHANTLYLLGCIH